MKKLIALILAVVLCLGALAGCEKAPEAPVVDALANAKSYLFTMYKDLAGKSLRDFDLVSVVNIGGVSYNVEWTADVSEDLVKVVPGDKKVTIDINEEPAADVTFTLTATVKDADGNVVFDSHADKSAMENHADREEIKEALTYGAGSSMRQSATLTEQTIYEATRLEDGSVLRISVSRATAFVLVLGMVQPIAIVLVIAIILSALLASRMANRIVEPLNRLNLEKPMENDAYEELAPLLRRIHSQHKEIEYQMWTLQKKQDEFEQITDNMKEALVLLDGNGRIISINPAAKKLFGINTDCIGEDFLTIDRKQDMRQAISEVKDKGQSFFYTKKNGRNYQFDLSRIDADGKIHGIVILAFDITEQVNAEKHRQEFTANVSHELKTPLQTIIGSAELMELGIVKEEDTPRFIKSIRQEAARLVTLIDDIIRLSQLDEGTEMPKEDVSLLEVAREVTET